MPDPTPRTCFSCYAYGTCVDDNDIRIQGFFGALPFALQELGFKCCTFRLVHLAAVGFYEVFH